MSLFAPTGGKAAKFLEIGATITGQIAAMPFEKQATKFGSQDLDFWPNGDPKMDIVLPLENTNAPREDANDDGDRTVYVSSKNMRMAIAQAIQAAGQQDVAIGGTITLTYVGNDPNSKNPANPAKLYQAQYSAPATGFAQPAAPAAVPAPAPAAQAYPQQPAAAAPMPQQAPQPQHMAPTMPAAAAPTPAAAPAPIGADFLGIAQATYEQIKQLLALGGLAPEQIAAATGTTVEQVTAVADKPF